ncbi:MAG: Qat anti-phage system TatD family nuclease QatD [Clostridia bacterium]
MIDTHVHLDLFQNAMNVVSEVSRKNEFTLTVTTSPKAWILANKYFAKYPNIAVALGMHPENLKYKMDEIDLFISNITKTRFIGEIGIDGSYNNKDSLNAQKMFFSRAISECYLKGGKIISIHSRNASSSVLDILEKQSGTCKIILHWFTGSLKDVERALDIGCYFSINPAMFISKSGQRIISKLPLHRVVPESDGPFVNVDNKIVMPWEATRQVALGFMNIINVEQGTILEYFKKNLKSIMQ